MPIAITDDHRALAKTASDFLSKNGARGAARALLEAQTEPLPGFWAEMGNIGWLGLHLPEKYGGSGFGLPELVIVAEELGRAVAPGPFVPTVIATTFASTIKALLGSVTRPVSDALVDWAQIREQVKGHREQRTAKTVIETSRRISRISPARFG